LAEGAVTHHYGGQTAGLSSDAAGSFHPFWIDNRTGTPQVWTATVKVNGNVLRNGSAELSDLEDVSERLALRIERPHYDRERRMLSVDLRLQNVSREPIRGILKARVISLKSDAVAMLMSNGRSMPAVGAVIDLTPLLEGVSFRLWAFQNKLSIWSSSCRIGLLLLKTYKEEAMDYKSSI